MPQNTSLISELKKGENSKKVKNFDGENYLKELHAKHVNRLKFKR